MRLPWLNNPPQSNRKSIQHRDIKPQNLLLCGGSVKVGDFGLVRSLKSDQTSHTGSLTLAYAAPEFFDGTTSHQSDQYSLAVTYCQLRGGRFPFEGSQSEVVMGHLKKPPDLTMIPTAERAAVEKALQKRPQNRWKSCSDFVAALSETVSSRPLAKQSKPEASDRQQKNDPEFRVRSGRGVTLPTKRILQNTSARNHIS